MARRFDSLYGNASVKEYLSAAIAEHRLPQALIIEGREGSGKKTLATEIACALADEPIQEEKIRNGLCPDLFWIMPPSDRKSIGVETARTIKEQASVAPNDLNCKIFVIVSAQLMTVQAQNALLKILEEPSNETYFLLLCENASGVIPTVRSRAPVLTMERFSQTELEAYLLENDESAKQSAQRDISAFRLLLHRADGTVGQALALLKKSQAMPELKAACDFLTVTAHAGMGQYLAAAEALPPDREKLRSFLLVLRYALHDLLWVKSVMLRDMSLDARKSADAQMLCYGSAEEAENAASDFTVRSLLGMDTALTAAVELLESNANLSNTKLKLATEFRLAGKK